MVGDRSASIGTAVHEEEQEWQECTNTSGATP